MSKLFALYALLFAPLVLHDCGSLGTREAFVPVSEIDVIDGDTFYHGDDRYRLKGFDTPETYFPKCAAEYELGQKAKDRLADLLYQNGGVDLQIDPVRDNYGRFLAWASVDGNDVGSILISEGLARPYAGGKRPPWCSFLKGDGG